MLPKSESNSNQKSNNTDPKESNANKDEAIDELLQSSIKTGTRPFIYWFILIFQFSISNNGLTLDNRYISYISNSTCLVLVRE